MTTSKLLADQTPSEIDAQLAKLYYDGARLVAQIEQTRKLINHYSEPKYYAFDDLVEKSEQKLLTLLDAYNANTEAKLPLNEEFVRRGGWTRAYLVNNTNGHVHSSMNCGTCFPTTEYVWMTDYSDATEDQIVQDAGNRACTVCYPTAPVEYLSRPTKMFTPDEVEKAKARTEREAKRVAKDAAKVYNHMTGEELYKTERGASNAILENLNSMLWYGSSHPSYANWEHHATLVNDALAEKLDVDAHVQYAGFMKKAEKKVAKDRKEAEAYATARGW